MRGRKPVPSKIKLIKGNPGHYPLPENEPQPRAEMPKCPSWLDKEAKREWKRMVKELEWTGIITIIDKAILARYCDNYSKWQAAEKILQTMPMVKFHKDGYAEINPYFRVANKAKEMMIKDMVEMGMTPSSRARVKVNEPKPKGTDKKQRFFK